MHKKFTIDFINETLDQYNLKLVGDYSNSRNKILVVNEDGIEYYIWFKFKNNKFPKPDINSAVNPQEAFKYEANKIFNNMFDYSDTVYKGSKNNITFKYGNEVFEQIAGNHLKGHLPLKLSDGRGWSFKEWLNISKKSIKFDSYKLYKIRCFNDYENFYKVGITFRSIYDRFGRGMTKGLPYEYEVIDIIEGSAKFIWDLEKIVHNKLKDFRYLPEISFNGETECFSKIEY